MGGENREQLGAVLNLKDRDFEQTQSVTPTK